MCLTKLERWRIINGLIHLNKENKIEDDKKFILKGATCTGRKATVAPGNENSDMSSAVVMLHQFFTGIWLCL